MHLRHFYYYFFAAVSFFNIFDFSQLFSSCTYLDPAGRPRRRPPAEKVEHFPPGPFLFLLLLFSFLFVLPPFFFFLVLILFFLLFLIFLLLLDRPCPAVPHRLVATIEAANHEHLFSQKKIYSLFNLICQVLLCQKTTEGKHNFVCFRPHLAGHKKFHRYTCP